MLAYYKKFHKQWISSVLILAITSWSSESFRPTNTIKKPIVKKSITLHLTKQEYLEFKNKHRNNPSFIELTSADSLNLKESGLKSPNQILSDTLKHLNSQKDSALINDSLNTERLDSIQCQSFYTDSAQLDSCRNAIHVPTTIQTESTKKNQAIQKKRLQSSRKESNEAKAEDVYTGVNITGEILNSANDTDELAVLVFIVIGFVVVATLIVTGLKILVDVTFNKKKLPRWTEFSGMYTFSYNSINEDLSNEYSQFTNMVGLKLSTGLLRQHIGVGVVGEVGNVNIRIHKSDFGSALNVNNFYFLMGPIIKLGGLEGINFDLEFLNGFSPSKEIGWVGKAVGVFNIPVQENLFLGLSFGSFFVDLKEIQGTIIQDFGLNLEMSLLYGASFGYRF